MPVKSSVLVLTFLIYILLKLTTVSAGLIKYEDPEELDSEEYEDSKKFKVPEYVITSSSPNITFLMADTNCPFKIVKKNNVTEVECVAELCNKKCVQISLVDNDKYLKIACVYEFTSLRNLNSTQQKYQ